MKSQNKRLVRGFGMVSSDVIRDPDVSLREKSVYAYLASYANSETNEVYVGVKRMASENGVTESTIKRILNSLSKKGIIFRQTTKVGSNTKTVLLK